jgi:hypothetical protein
VSVPNDRASVTQTPPTTASRARGDGKRIFRMGPPQVIWWIWVGLGIISLADYVIQARVFVSPEFLFGWLAITGLVYACAEWPMVIADERGLEVRNPIRRYLVPWVAVRGIYLADSVEVECARQAQKKNKTIYSWALSSPRRARARAQLRGWQWDQGKRNKPSGYSSLPDQAKSLAKMTTAEVMARELATMSEEARFRSVMGDVDLGAGPAQQDAPVPSAGAGQETERPSAGEPDASRPGGENAEVLSATWSWPAILAFLVPAIGFCVTLLVK